MWPPKSAGICSASYTWDTSVSCMNSASASWSYGHPVSERSLGQCRTSGTPLHSLHCPQPHGSGCTHSFLTCHKQLCDGGACEHWVKGAGGGEGGEGGGGGEVGHRCPHLLLLGIHLVLELWHYLDWHFPQQQHWTQEGRTCSQRNMRPHPLPPPLPATAAIAAGSVDPWQLKLRERSKVLPTPSVATPSSDPLIEEEDMEAEALLLSLGLAAERQAEGWKALLGINKGDLEMLGLRKPVPPQIRHRWCYFH